MAEAFDEMVARNRRAEEETPDHKPDGSGLDDGICYLPGCAPRKKPAPKPAVEISALRKRAWETRRSKYGEHGHR